MKKKYNSILFELSIREVYVYKIIRTFEKIDLVFFGKLVKLCDELFRICKNINN